jgi:UDP-N-acetylmuramyl pentapeptide synthase
MAWSRDEIVIATHGTIVNDGKEKIFGEVVTNSGQVKQGSVFVALKGERLDGHRFVREAVSRGARCVIIHRSVRHSDLRDAMVVRVGDTLRALGDLAHYRRQKIAP